MAFTHLTQWFQTIYHALVGFTILIVIVIVDAAFIYHLVRALFFNGP